MDHSVNRSGIERFNGIAQFHMFNPQVSHTRLYSPTAEYHRLWPTLISHPDESNLASYLYPRTITQY